MIGGIQEQRLQSGLVEAHELDAALDSAGLQS
jgi:hypothetical protein